MSFIASPQFSCHFFPELFHSSKHICYLELAVRGAESGRSQQLGEPTFHFWWLPPWPLRSTEVVVPAPEWGAAGGGKRMFWILFCPTPGSSQASVTHLGGHAGPAVAPRVPRLLEVAGMKRPLLQRTPLIRDLCNELLGAHTLWGLPGTVFFSSI